MKKLSDKIISFVCCVAMVLITCFGVSYKVAHKTYADTTPTTKQNIGMWFASLLASMGARIYITTAQGYEWLVDNFNEVMRMSNLTYTLGELVEDAQQRYNEQSSTLTLPELPSKAISIFLENLWNNGFRQDSIDYDVGSFEENVLGTYTTLKDGVMMEVGTAKSGTQNQYCLTRGHDCRVVAVYNPKSPSSGMVVMVSTNSTGDAWQGTGKTASSATGSRRNWNYSSSTINGVRYYWNDSWMSSSRTYNIANVPSTYGTGEMDYVKSAIEYCYGASAVEDGVQEIQVYGDGTLGLDDMVNTADRDKDVEIDYNDLLGAEAGAKTFAEVMEKIRAILEGEQEGAIPQAEVIVKTIVPVPGDLPIPLIFEGLPEIVKPECENLSACLVSGVQTASQHLQNVYNSNSSVANYTMVSLAIGIALYILTGGI